MPLTVFCENVELAAEVTALAGEIGLSVTTELTVNPLDAAAHHARGGARALALAMTLPSAEAAVRALDVCSDAHCMVLGALSDLDGLQRGALADLGFPCVGEVATGLAALALLEAGGERAYRANARKLSLTDRARLSHVLQPTEKGAGRLQSMGAQRIRYESDAGRSVVLGTARDVADALAALARADRGGELGGEFELPQHWESAREVLFGPPRTLSDPASKAALLPFGLPMPQEELCASASRASVEASRIGFPVRISLASPDLRVWDYPELSVDGVDNAARVRDVFRQLSATAEARAPNARVLGVTVTATTLARALLRVTAKPLPNGHVLLRVGFSDPHGAVVRDAIATVLPMSERGLARALASLQGHKLLWSEGQSREATVRPLLTLLVRLGSFMHAFRREVAKVELHPVALLVGGGAEVREAAVEVTDAFVRDLER